MQAANRSRSMIAVFGAMLSSLGANLRVLELVERDPRKEHTERKFDKHATLRPLSAGEYTSQHGTVYRVRAKRDKSMSARQWKRHIKAQRRAIAENNTKDLAA